ncbi:TPA: restriction endonuclease subunit S [Enterobacter kobei]|uniref:restriction endonuclease subunit S n=1 Tax=Enterobacter TaxID=547 RepID=UPI0007938F46|nr:restriction endonuclease subunit S [Enterobacter kobei]SAF17743.1 restriction modification system DNA specificity domain-containing protein [Enterobacter kobei]HDS5030998.1 restriction endonuclease subunit S [Enterobacter kobei]
MAKYKAYPEYKDSRVEWLGMVPSHWNIKRLGQFFEERRDKVSDKDYPPLSVTMQGIVPQIDTAAKTDAGDNRKLVLKNDFVINSRSDRKGSSGVSQLDGSVSLISIVMEPKRINPKFAHHLLRSYPFQEEFYRYGKGIVADLWSTNSSEMKNILIPELADDESNAIACFLDHETAKIDNLIEKQQQLIKLLKEKRQAVISHAVTKGLNPDVPMKDSGVEWFGEVPAHWVVMHMRHAIVRIEQGKSPECEARNAEENEWGVLKSGCVNSGLFNEKEHKALPPSIIPNIEYEVHPGDLIMSRASGSVDLIGSMAFVYNCRTKLLLSDKTFRVIPTKKIASEFLSHLMGSLPMRNQIKLAINGAEGLANNITKESIKSFYMVAPSFSEQIEIASFITGKNKIFDLLETKLNNSIKLLQERRTALISATVTGKIDVRDWVAPDAQDVEAIQEATA